MSYVAGYTVAHDVSARDWQIRKNGGQWLIGKTFDTFCPIGPAIVTLGAISGRPLNTRLLLGCMPPSPPHTHHTHTHTHTHTRKHVCGNVSC